MGLPRNIKKPGFEKPGLAEEPEAIAKTEMSMAQEKVEKVTEQALLMLGRAGVEALPLLLPGLRAVVLQLGADCAEEAAGVGSRRKK